MRTRSRLCLTFFAAVWIGATPAAALAANCVDPAAVARAERFARDRPGSVSFAAYEGGTLRSVRGAVPYRSASIVKVMLLVADLREHAEAGRPLTSDDRERLSTMIRVSGNRAATATFTLVGRDAVLDVGRRVGMRHSTVGDHWSSSQITAADQARLFRRLETVLPREHRAFGLELLETIVRRQTWGGARVARRAGFETVFKPGWFKRAEGGWVVHQGLRVKRDGCTVGIAVLTAQQPTMSDGVTTIRGVVERLLGIDPSAEG